MTTTLARIRIRRATGAQWISANPILGNGEIAWETDTDIGKVGDGTTSYLTLPYALGVGTALESLASKVSVNEAPINPLHPTYGAKFDGVTDDTAAVQAALDDAWTSSGSRPVVLQPGRTTGGGQANIKISQLKLNQGQVIDGGSNGMFTTRLIRQSGATGPMLREKTAAEGGSGAQGISLRNLFLDCNSVAGNGIDLGNQGGPDWGFNGVIEDVHVRNASADGFSLNADAVTGRNLSAYFNGGSGVKISGHGDNNWFQVSCSQNVASEMDLSGTDDSFFGVHIEPLAAEAIIVRASGVGFWGLSCFQKGNITDLVDLVGSIGSTAIYNASISPNGFTVTNWVKCEVTTALTLAAPSGTSSAKRLKAWIDNRDTEGWYMVNSLHGTQVAYPNNSQVSAQGYYRMGLATGKTANYTVGAGDSVVMCAGAGGFTITLPAGSSFRGREITVLNKGSGAVTVAAASGTVDTTSLAASTGRATYISDGTNWITVAG